MKGERKEKKMKLRRAKIRVQVRETKVQCMAGIGLSGRVKGKKSYRDQVEEVCCETEIKNVD